MSQEKSVFPSCKQEALAMSYVQAQDLSSKTPEEVAVIYDYAYSKICDAFKAILKEQQEKRRNENPPRSIF